MPVLAYLIEYQHPTAGWTPVVVVAPGAPLEAERQFAVLCAAGTGRYRLIRLGTESIDLLASGGRKEETP